MPKMTVVAQRWPTRDAFRIAGYTFTDCEVILVELEHEGLRGRGEAAGVYYHQETPASMIQQIEQARSAVERGISRQELRELLPPGGARCALDSALWDLAAKASGVPAFQAAGLEEPHGLETTYTVGAGPAEEMAAAAAAYAPAGRLKVKLTGREDEARLRAVRAARPDAWIAVDANQGLTRESLRRLLPLFVELDIRLIEQPLPVGAEEQLRGVRSPIPLAADESVQSLEDIAGASGLFQVVNIKLDKCGGLTEALEMVREIRRLGMQPMVGCMQGTTLSVAPACIVAGLCEVVDLDAPTFLTEDRVPSAVYENGRLTCPRDWGYPQSDTSQR